MNATLKKYTAILYQNEDSKIIVEYLGKEGILMVSGNAWSLRLSTVTKLVNILNMVSMPGYKAGSRVVGTTAYVLPEYKHKY